MRLLYAGRLTRAKGVFDLPLIDAQLVRRGINVIWTIQGDGPDAAELKASPEALRKRLGRLDVAEFKPVEKLDDSTFAKPQ